VARCRRRWSAVCSQATGFPVVKSAVAGFGGGSRRALAGQVGYPMVVKVMSADVPHRSDVGAVQLGIKDEAGLRAALALIEKKRPGKGSRTPSSTATRCRRS